MADPADDLADLLAAVFTASPARRQALLRPRPNHMPHPILRLAKLSGVVRAPRRGYRLKSMEQPSIPPMKTGWPVLIRLISDSFIGRQ